MLGTSFKLTKKFAFDIDILYMYRQFSDGIEFFRFEVNWDRFEGDHKPSFTIMWVMCNFVILDFEIYNVNHLPPIM